MDEPPRTPIRHRRAPTPGRAWKAAGVLRRKWFVVMGTLTVTAIALAVISALLYVGERAGERDEDRRNTVIAAARQEVLALLSLSGKDTASTTAQLNRVISGATGSLRRQFAPHLSSLSAALVQAKLTQVGKINALGINRINAKDAVVTVQAQSTIANDTSPKGAVQLYRMSVSLARTGGRWLVSDVGIVS